MEEHPIDIAVCSDEVKAIYHKLKPESTNVPISVPTCPELRGGAITVRSTTLQNPTIRSDILGGIRFYSSLPSKK